MDSDEDKSRLRNIDWKKVIALADAEPGKAQYVGVMDQSMRTHIKKGRFSYIDPAKYEVWTRRDGEARNRARLYILRKPQ